MKGLKGPVMDLMWLYKADEKIQYCCYQTKTHGRHGGQGDRRTVELAVISLDSRRGLSIRVVVR